MMSETRDMVHKAAEAYRLAQAAEEQAAPEFIALAIQRTNATRDMLQAALLQARAENNELEVHHGEQVQRSRREHSQMRKALWASGKLL